MYKCQIEFFYFYNNWTNNESNLEEKRAESSFEALTENKADYKQQWDEQSRKQLQWRSEKHPGQQQ